MKTPMFKILHLQALGFELSDTERLDDGGNYQAWSFTKNDSRLDLMYVFDSANRFELGYFEFNGEKLQGRPLTKRDVKLLIEIM